MTTIDILKLTGLIEFVIFLLWIAITLIWWACGMKAICNMFDESRGPRE